MVKGERERIYELCLNLGAGTATKGFLNADRYKARPVYITSIIRNVDAINALYQALIHSTLPIIERSPTGAIAKHNIHHASGAYDVREVTTKKGIFKGIIITVLLFNRIFVFKCGMFSVKDKKDTGFKAFREFCSRIKAMGKTLDDYKIENGEEVKESISSPYIKFLRKYQKIQHVNHMDMVCAWGSGFAKAFPEFETIIKEMEQKDKILPSVFLGYCQSEYCDYAFSHFAKAGIEFCNKKMQEYTEQLEAQDFEIIGYNTDGIWYVDKLEQGRLFHNDEEGNGLGQWRNDHVDCELCAYGDGQYWFREDGKFNVRARGYYYYEQEKPREEWDEKDFDRAMSCETSVTFIRGRGFVIHLCRKD